MVALALAAAAALFAIATALVHAAGQARARALAADVRTSIEPYLLRKAAEAGFAVAPPSFTRRTPPEEVLAWSSKLAARLLDHERGVAPASATAEVALARTQPVDGG